MSNNFDEFSDNNGSGWNFDDIIDGKLIMGRYTPLTGSQYIELPHFVKTARVF